MVYSAMIVILCMITICPTVRAAVCSSSVTNCAYCSYSSSCSTCNPGYYLYSGDCYKCAANCYNCTSSGSSGCTNCTAGYTIQNSTGYCMSEESSKLKSKTKVNTYVFVFGSVLVMYLLTFLCLKLNPETYYSDVKVQETQIIAVQPNAPSQFNNPDVLPHGFQAGAPPSFA